MEPVLLNWRQKLSFSAIQKLDVTRIGLLNLNGVPIKGTPSGDGDGLLWAGLIHSVAVGNKEGVARGIIDCQNYSGRIFRSPNRVNKDRQNSASRDMAMGFILYLATSQDVSASNMFLSYISQNKKLCDNDTDCRCSVTLPLWWAIKLATQSDVVPWYARWSYFLYPFYLILAALTTPAGYQMHLVGVHSLLRLIKKKEYSTAAKILFKRKPGNPFFASLAGQIESASVLTDKYYKEWIETKAKSQDPLSEWLWERDYKKENFSVSDSMIWDFVFMSHFLYQQKFGFLKDV